MKNVYTKSKKITAVKKNAFKSKLIAFSVNILPLSFVF